MISLPDPVYIVTILIALGLAPFVAIMVTSFVKLVVVLSLIRNALGVQQVPPNLVINGLAIILTFYIMAPVLEDTYDIVATKNLAKMELPELRDTLLEASHPLRQFLKDHSDRDERQFFLDSAKRLWPKERADRLSENDLLVLVPAFTVTELTAAFQIGFLIYLPFLVIDLVVSNILLAMGMMMVSPMTISLPFKLLLFVLIDGWAKLIQGLVLTYT